MVNLNLKIVRKNEEVLYESSGIDNVHLVSKLEYEEGDKIVLESSEKDIFLVIQIDDALGSSFVYIDNNKIEYIIPFGEKRISYSPKVFFGNRHYLYARIATEIEINTYKNLALNVMDQHEIKNCYPHGTANVETRGESVFAARNAMDGVIENRGHGKWPYQSWGINQQDDAMMRIDFGRKVSVNKIVLYTRADFPHDNWWEQATFVFSDGSEIDFSMTKSQLPHELKFDEKIIEWIKLERLIKSDDPSPFPALTQMEVYGVEA